MERFRWQLKIAFKSLIRRKNRTFLMFLSLTLASGLATTFFSFSTGARLGLGKELRAYGANLVISPLSREAGSAGLVLGQVFSADFLEVKKLKNFLQEQPEVKEANFQLQIRGDYQKQPLLFLGLEKKALLNASRFWRIRGRLPEEKNEVLAGSQLAKNAGIEPGVEMKVKLNKREIKIKVTGLLESGGLEDRALVLDFSTLSSLAKAKGKASQVLVRIEPTSKVEQVKEKIARAFSELQVSTLQQVIKREENIVKKVERLLLLTTAFVLLATSISIANTTSTTIVERWREIGLLKSLGSSSWLVLSLFLLEAFSLAFLAALSGFLIGWILTELFALSVFSLLVPFIWWSLPASLLVSFLIVFLSSIWPLRLVFKIDPALVLKGQ